MTDQIALWVLFVLLSVAYVLMQVDAARRERVRTITKRTITKATLLGLSIDHQRNAWGHGLHVIDPED